MLWGWGRSRRRVLKVAAGVERFEFEDLLWKGAFGGLGYDYLLLSSFDFICFL